MYRGQLIFDGTTHEAQTSIELRVKTVRPRSHRRTALELGEVRTRDARRSGHRARRLMGRHDGTRHLLILVDERRLNEEQPRARVAPDNANMVTRLSRRARDSVPFREDAGYLDEPLAPPPIASSGSVIGIGITIILVLVSSLIITGILWALGIPIPD